MKLAPQCSLIILCTLFISNSIHSMSQEKQNEQLAPIQIDIKTTHESSLNQQKAMTIIITPADALKITPTAKKTTPKAKTPRIKPKVNHLDTFSNRSEVIDPCQACRGMACILCATAGFTASYYFLIHALSE